MKDIEDRKEKEEWEKEREKDNNMWEKVVLREEKKEENIREKILREKVSQNFINRK